ncbi:hypothetical protein AURDEDRAFT_163042 [Auricularia subglabra TFB-10046 SS5]|nr:hypothetical protein AURDEDRAFT_163042 [Auricularia subglabra TFB-10046 SS5]
MSSSSKRRASADPPAIAWHHVLAGILVNDGNDERQPVDQIINFLGALNQARPDLPGCFSVTATRAACRLWWSDAAGIYATPRLPWDDPSTPSRLLTLVYRLHHPLAVDSTISLESMTQRSAHYDQKPVWHPWTRKNCVAAASEHRSGEAQSFVPCSRVVIKDSFPLIENEAFVEDAILDHLHGVGVIPGICSPISSFLVANDGDHVRSIEVPVSGPKPRRKHRLVMLGDGEDLYRCPSVLRFIMMMYDVLEVLRYSHEQRGVMHRDISLRNVLHSPVAVARAPFPGCKFASEVLAHKYPQISACMGPACILIDFDNAVCQGRSPEAAPRQCVGTPAFVARNVSRDFRIVSSPTASPLPELVGNAKQCYIQAFGQQHYDDLSALLESSKAPYRPVRPELAAHRPHHDAESCYFLIVHFLLTALPHKAIGDNDESEVASIIEILEQNRFGSLIDLRGNLMELLQDEWADYLHPQLRSLGGFLSALGDTVRPIFDLFEPPLPPYHLHDAMQCVLLQEACRLLDHDALPLNPTARRSFHSYFKFLPTALKQEAALPQCKAQREWT